MPDAFVVHYRGVAPIPVGNEVEVRVFTVDTAVFGTKLEPQFDDPLIVDLTTGILYGERSQFEDYRMGQTDALSPGMPLLPRADLREHGRWRGRVTATRIATLDHGYVQTSLSILPTEAGRPYGA